MYVRMYDKSAQLQQQCSTDQTTYSQLPVSYLVRGASFVPVTLCRCLLVLLYYCCGTRPGTPSLTNIDFVLILVWSSPREHVEVWYRV